MCENSLCAKCSSSPERRSHAIHGRNRCGSLRPKLLLRKGVHASDQMSPHPEAARKQIRCRRIQRPPGNEIDQQLLSARPLSSIFCRKQPPHGYLGQSRTTTADFAFQGKCWDSWYMVRWMRNSVSHRAPESTTIVWEPMTVVTNPGWTRPIVPGVIGWCSLCEKTPREVPSW